ncbi:hypothetical protein K1719_021033 [Acacia pycnantha]|nr:hypothetical protein K1719_021033 [Acacia pycnantha]
MNSVTKLTAERLVKLNGLLAELTRSGLFSDCFKLFGQIHSSCSLRPDQYTLSTALTACANNHNVYFGNQLHAYAVGTGLKAYSFVANSLLSLHAKAKDLNSVIWVFKDIEYPDVYSWTTLLAACTRLANIGYAFQLFVEMPKSNVAIWNAIITGCTDNGHEKVAMYLFREMHRMDVKPDNYTLASILSLCSLKTLDYGRHVHSAVIKTGCLVRASVINSLITMYFSGECVADAFLVFEEVKATICDCITYNAMIDGLVGVERNEDAFLMFKKMQEACLSPTELTFENLGASAILIFEEMRRHGKMNQAFQVFSDLPHKNLTSWNCLISGFLVNGYPLQGLEEFSEFLNTKLKPNVFTLTVILSICSSISALSLGQQIHGYIIRHEFSSDISLGNALITMYAKSGSLDMSLRVFNAMVERDTISWNAIISAYAQHGQGKEAVRYFEAMQNSPEIKPDEATFTAVLSACSHAGLVDDGTRIFYSMVKNYECMPNVDHFSCIVDLLGRSGHLEEAERVINGGKFGAHCNICWSLFSACAAHGNLRLGRTIAKILLEREGDNPSVYVLLSNIYASAGHWEEAANLRDSMKMNGTTKQPGYSWIGV